MSKAKVVMIGAGHLGSLILKGWIKKKIVPTKDLQVFVRSPPSAQSLAKQFPKLNISHSEEKKLPVGDIYVIAVKPQQWAELKGVLKSQIKKSSLVVSIMAGIPPSRLEAELGCACVVAMTNTALQVDTAITTLFKSPATKSSQLLWINKAFAPFGLVAELDEKDFASATVLGGSHPAFAVWMLGELSKIISTRLPSQDGMEWVLQVFRGADKLIRKKRNVTDILAQIATPGGCTAEGLKALEELGISGKLALVFDQSQRKAENLGK